MNEAETTLDLAAILQQIDAAQKAAARPTWARGEEAMFDEDRQDSEFVRLLWTHWPAIRAALERQAALEAALREIQDLGRLSPEEYQGQRDSKLVRMVEPFAFTSSHSRTNAIELGRRAWAEADKLTQRMRDRARLALSTGGEG